MVAAQTFEGLRLDFKRELPAGSSDAIREFLADVSSFANTEGGHILYGVDESGGSAKQISGVMDADHDATKLHLTESDPESGDYLCRFRDRHPLQLRVSNRAPEYQEG